MDVESRRQSVDGNDPFVDSFLGWTSRADGGHDSESKLKVYWTDEADSESKLKVYWVSRWMSRRIVTRRFCRLTKRINRISSR
ncbi:hypothetical protein QE152_g30157 [Popillia japonica]|uniref:Uncharacterized protein n=1 Tax=Popillia japonica TaxID=7064 RepID=A0AAW1JF56_POPJA